jgi:hypothetical protein
MAAQCAIASRACLAPAARQGRVDQHPIANLDIVNPVTEGRYDSRRIAAQYMWQRHLDAGSASAHEQVEMIERRRPDIDHDIIVTGRRIIEIPHAQDLGPTVFFEIDSLHVPWASR